MEAPKDTWAVLSCNGTPVFIDIARNEDDVWRIFTGWGTEDEIAEKKAAGLRAVRVDVIERKP